MSVTAANYLNAAFFSITLVVLLVKFDKVMAIGSGFTYALFSEHDPDKDEMDDWFFGGLMRFMAFCFFFAFAINGFTKWVAGDAMFFSLFCFASYKETNSKTKGKKQMLIIVFILCIIIAALCITKLDDHSFKWCIPLKYCENIKNGVCSFRLTPN